MPVKVMPVTGFSAGRWAYSSYIINMACYDDKQSYAAIIDRMMWWYAGAGFPTERFDDISAIPKQVQVQAMTPLCHTSVSKWTLAAGVEVTSRDKYERCAKVAGEVVYTVVYYLNEYFDSKWKPVKWALVGKHRPLRPVPWAGNLPGLHRWHEPAAGAHGAPALPYRPHQIRRR